MEKPAEAKVAVVSGDRRRGAVAEAFSLIAGEVAGVVGPNTVIIPHLSGKSGSGSSTHSDTLSATVDAILAAGAERIAVAGRPRPDRGFDHFGYTGEVWGRPVAFLDLAEIGEESPASVEIHLGLMMDRPKAIRVSRRIAGANCRISLAVARKSGILGGSLGLFNVLNVLAQPDRTRFDTRGIIPGRLPFLFSRTLHRNREAAGEENRLRNLLVLTRALRPTVSLVDTLSATKRSGPGRKMWSRQGLIFAGTDPVAVDAVAAMFLGYDRRRVGYLGLAESMGMGIADLDRIEIVGDRPIRAGRSSGRMAGMHRPNRRSSVLGPIRETV